MDTHLVRMLTALLSNIYNIFIYKNMTFQEGKLAFLVYYDPMTEHRKIRNSDTVWVWQEFYK